MKDKELLKAEEFIKILDAVQKMGLIKLDYSKFWIKTNKKGYVTDYVILK